MRVYISGPMTGLPGLNYDEFNHKAILFRTWGHEVSNPTEQVGEGKTWSEFLKGDLVELILKCDAVYVLPGWEQSEGACLEICVAQALGIPVYIDTWFNQELDKEIILAINLSPQPRRKDR